MRFPGESDGYRSARNELLEAEKDLRRNVERVAAMRRTLPLGGAPREDYVFDGADGPVRLSELFEGGKDSLIVYSYMFGPQMAQPCVSCTSILDALDGEAPHVVQRVNFAVVAKSPIERILGFTKPRGWRNLRLLSSAGNTYNRDYGAENEKGAQMPMANVFVRRDGKVHHFYGTELLFEPPEAGQDGRHVDMFWPLWNLFDLTPEGRGTDWYPRLSY
ncbi:MAG TPA: DUF899 family protein [Thermoanaerobaculia bacterium]|jgi:predicted dithiol-disulfide oxidoreductase (DUF899 family)